MRRQRLTLSLVAGLLAVGACSSTTADPGSSSAAPSDSVSADTRPADPHESMDHSATGSMDMATMSSAATSSVAPAAPVLPSSVPPPAAPVAPAVDVLPGMPPVVDPNNIYSEAGANMLGPSARQSKAYAYVPHSKSGDVWVIDQATFQVVDRFSVGIEVQHVVPSWDMSALYATDDIGNVIRRIDPFTGQAGDTIPVTDP